MGDQIVTGLQFCIWFVQRQDGASFLDQLQTEEKQNQYNLFFLRLNWNMH